MDKLFLVGIGGFIGSITRYLISGRLLSEIAYKQIPIGTLLVNLLGCLAVGIVSGILENRFSAYESVRLSIIVGFLGGFTTFSAFGLEAITLLRNDQLMACSVYIAVSVLGGVVLVYLGMRFSSLF